MSRCTCWVASAALSGCSLWYADLPAAQCASNADCEALAEGSVCDIEQRVCLAPSLDLSLTADNPAACHELSGVTAAECPGCAERFSSDCTCLAGAWDDPDALVVGVIAPETFGSLDGQTLQIPYVARWQKSLTLALEEWRSELPDGVLPRSRRPLALLHCNSHDDRFRARRAMQHLVNLGSVPVVITLTDNDTNTVRPQSLRDGLTLICASCFSDPRQGSLDPSSVWQVAPALFDQAELAVARAVELAPPDVASPPTLVTLSQEYPGIDTYVSEIVRRVQQQNGYRQVSVQSPDPRAQTVSQLDVAQAVVDARPEVIVVGMDSDFTTYYLPLIESRWPADAPRPAYVLSYMNQELGLLSGPVGSDDELRHRISGVGWWPGPEAAINRSRLEERFLARYREAVEQTQFGYDAFYAAAYALAWADARMPLDGAGAALGLEHLRQGPRVDAAPESIRSALVQLQSGDDVDLVGSSGALDWDAATHATASDVSLWCLVRDADGRLALRPSAGPIWNAMTGEISGAYACP
ncbi:MAG TPA: hypothetical protein VMG12_09805 [Polyangiaceae bacterium]|nr:hypothetical protein [Polyangiaceae bacterium]